MQATILDLRRRMPEVLRALDRHEEVTILYRGKKRAVLVPAEAVTDTRERNKVITDHAAFGMWASRDDLTDVATHVRTLRRGRVHAI
jgi:antitoxin (DNA-binding transcriptional repressor) of toxin-antitoxin stability system